MEQECGGLFSAGPFSGYQAKQPSQAEHAVIPDIQKGQRGKCHGTEAGDKTVPQKIKEIHMKQHVGKRCAGTRHSDAGGRIVFRQSGAHGIFRPCAQAEQIAVMDPVIAQEPPADAEQYENGNKQPFLQQGMPVCTASTVPRPFLCPVVGEKRKKEKQDGGEDEAVCIIIGKGTTDNPDGKRDAVLPTPPGLPPGNTGAEHNGAGHGCHGIGVYIRVQKQVLRQKHNQKTEKPSGQPVLKQQKRKPADINSHNDAEYGIDHPGAEQQRHILLRKERQNPHQNALYYIRKNWLKCIRAAVSADGDFEFFPGGQFAVTADKLCNFKAIYLIRGIAERLQKDKTKNGE